MSIRSDTAFNVETTASQAFQGKGILKILCINDRNGTPSRKSKKRKLSPSSSP